MAARVVLNFSVRSEVGQATHAAEMPVKFQNDAIMIAYLLATSRLHEILQ